MKMVKNSAIKKDKIIVIVGPTASGKSDLAVEIARQTNGEVVSADSRQVYRGLNIGTGKITKREMRGVPHHLLDVCSPKKIFTVAEYQKLATKAIDDILSRGKLPIICGGTGFYIQAVVDGIVLPEVAPNAELRAKLEKKSLTDLIKILTKLDPVRAKQIDQKNPRRLIRAIEIATKIGKVPKIKTSAKYDPTFIGIKIEEVELKKRISDRLARRIKQGMINEAKKLHDNGLSWKRMEELGLEYRFLAEHLQGKISRDEMIEQLENAIWQYAKRQMTWFKRDKRIKWNSKKYPKISR